MSSTSEEQSIPPSKFKLYDRVLVLTSTPDNAFVNGRVVTIMNGTHWVDGVWMYGVDLFPPFERSWILREDELLPVS